MNAVGIASVGMEDFQRQKPATLGAIVTEAVSDALAHLSLEFDDVDGIVYGSAVDTFGGIESPDQVASQALLPSPKPTVRISTSGSTAVTAPIAAANWVKSGEADIVMAVCFEQMSPNGAPQAVFNTVYDEFYVQPVGLNVPIQCAMEARRFLHKYGHTEEQMALVSVKNHRNAMDNPYAQLPMDLSVDDVMDSPYICWPIKRLDTSPTSDGARVAVFARAELLDDLERPRVMVAGTGQAGDSVWFMGRENHDLARLEYAYDAARQAYEMAAIDDPMSEIDVAEPYDPFTYKEMQHVEALGLCPEGGSGSSLERGVFDRDGDLPVNPSGGLLGEGNPIGAGMSRLCWLYRQLAGEADKCQVPGDPRTGVTCGWGGMYQYSAVMVLRRED